MKTKTLRRFVVDGRTVQFHLDRFKMIFYKHARDNKIKVGELEQRLADRIVSSTSTVHTWLHGSSGPSDLEKIKAIADFFQYNCNDFLIDVKDEETGEKNMNKRLSRNFTEDTIASSTSEYSYFTKHAILKAYDLVTEFIYKDDLADVFGFMELAIKIRNMRGFFPDTLHRKLFKFVMTDVKSMMLYDIPDIDDFEDDEVECLNVCLDAQFEVLKKFQAFAETEMEPYIGSKKNCDTSEEFDDKEKGSLLSNQYKQLRIDEMSEKRIQHLLGKGLHLFQILVNEDKKEVSEIISYAYDFNGESHYTSCFSVEELRNMLVTDIIIPVYNKEDMINKDVPAIYIEKHGPHLIEEKSAIQHIVATALAPHQDYGYNYHYEFFVSKGLADRSKLFGELELEFVEHWMIEKEYYNKRG